MICFNFTSPSIKKKTPGSLKTKHRSSQLERGSVIKTHRTARQQKKKKSTSLKSQLTCSHPKLCICKHYLLLHLGGIFTWCNLVILLLSCLRSDSYQHISLSSSMWGIFALLRHFSQAHRRWWTHCIPAVTRFRNVCEMCLWCSLKKKLKKNLSLFCPLIVRQFELDVWFNCPQTQFCDYFIKGYVQPKMKIQSFTYSMGSNKNISGASQQNRVTTHFPKQLK